MSEKSTAKRLTGGIIAVITLAICLFFTTFALVFASVSIENNFFTTGTVEINLNDDKQIISEDEFLFEPGVTVRKDFFVENKSSCSVYYRIYFDSVSGGLSDVLEITIKDGEKVLYSGTSRTLGEQSVLAADDILLQNEKRNLTVCFHFPENGENTAQNASLNFTVCAEATQVKNNPNKLFR